MTSKVKARNFSKRGIMGRTPQFAVRTVGEKMEHSTLTLNVFHLTLQRTYVAHIRGFVLQERRKAVFLM